MEFKHNIANLQTLNFLQRLHLKIGIVGGSFDPAHLGHLSISIQALNFYHFDYIIWLVANQNPMKSKSKYSIFERAKNALALVQHPRIIISTAEYDLNCYYTYDSLKALISRFPDCQFTWLMGADNIGHFKKWHRSNDICKLCNIIIFDRSGTTRMLNIKRLALNYKANLAKAETHNIIFHRGKLCDLSSTLIRSQNNEY